VELHEYFEDADAEGIQDPGSITAPASLLIEGSIDSCGFDPEASEPTWPEHPVDVDGDGLSDELAQAHGWYSGDVDLFALESSGGGSVSVLLEWDNAPAGDQNAPYQPGEPSGAWASESDLDWLVFQRGSAELGPIVSDAGFSRDYPPAASQLLELAAGEMYVLAVACHHELATDYRLSVDLIVP